MQRMITPLRVCRICGLEANTEAELSQFVRNKPSSYGYANSCKKCQREVSKQTMCKTNELIKTFRARSPDGIIKCHLCGEEITKLEGQDSDSLAIHSLDEDHENWNPTNKMPAHNSCHSRYHNTGKKSYRWKGDAASDSAKSSREWSRNRRTRND